MSANLDPIFPLVPIIGTARISAANKDRSGAGVVSTLVTGASSGTRVDKITFITSDPSTATNSAMLGRIFISDASGLNYRLYNEIAIPTTIANDTSIGAKSIIITGGLILPANVQLGVTTSVYASVVDQIDVIAEGGNY
jgi:hypothetical protein